MSIPNPNPLNLKPPLHPNPRIPKPSFPRIRAASDAPDASTEWFRPRLNPSPATPPHEYQSKRQRRRHLQEQEHEKEMVVVVRRQTEVHGGQLRSASSPGVVSRLLAGHGRRDRPESPLRPQIRGLQGSGLRVDRKVQELPRYGTGQLLQEEGEGDHQQVHSLPRNRK